MQRNTFEKIVNNFKARYLPEGDIELLDKQSLENHGFTVTEALTHSATRLIYEKENEMTLLTKITPMLFLKLSSASKSYNIGILKNIANKISEDIRDNAIVNYG